MKSLFNNLKQVGVDETTAYEVSNAMNPERYATWQDLVEAIAANREETQKTLSTNNRQLLLILCPIMVTLIGILVHIWH